jgi:polysaccharide pyruvyl transferase WcaK-like protein
MGRIKFVGWYRRGNCGDEAFRDVHRLLFGGQDIEWITDADAELAPDNDDSVYVLGGGDVFLPYYLRSIPANRKFFIYGVGLGSTEQRAAVVEQRHRILGAWLRNQEDVDELRAEGIEARFTPDIVFNLAPEISQRASAQAEQLQKGRKSVALIVSNTATQDSYRSGNMAEFFYAQYMRLILAKIFSELTKYYDVFCIPFSSDRNDFDLGYLYDIVTNMSRQETVRILDRPMEPLEIGAIVANMDMVVSMKFHGLVFAAAAGVPFVNIGLTRKTKLICSQLGLEDLSLPPYSLTVDSVLAAVKVAESSSLRSRLNAAREHARKLAAKEATLFVSKVQAALNDPSSTHI